MFSSSFSKLNQSKIRIRVTVLAMITTLCIKLATIAQQARKSVQKFHQSIVDLTASVASAYLKAIRKIKNNKFHKHHIVAQSSPKATLARLVLYSIKWDTNNLFNVISITQRLHSSLHTNLYFTAINSLFLSAWTKPNNQRVAYIIALYVTIHVVLYTFDAMLT